MEQPAINQPQNVNPADGNARLSRENQSESESTLSDANYCIPINDRKWILRDGHASSLRCERLSTMKNSFNYPEEMHKPNLGKRTQILLERMRREAEVEAVAEQETLPTVEKYLTTYDDTYCYPLDPTFEPKDPPRQRELYEKYPLYNNPASSYWHLEHARHISERPTVAGAAARVDFNSPFKRNASFSKPLEDIADGGPADR